MVVETSFNELDLAIFIIFGLSALLSFFRGFVREILSLGAWVGAAIITLYAFPTIAAQIQPHVKSSVIASGFAAMGTFMIALLSISLINAILMKFLRKGSDIGLLDNSLGLIFGVIRAALLVSLAYYIMSFMMAEKDMPEWVATSKSQPYLKTGAQILDKLAPAYLDDLSPLKKDADGNVLDDAEPIDAPVIDGSVESEDDEAVDKDSPSYRWMNVEELQNMLDKNKAEQESR